MKKREEQPDRYPIELTGRQLFEVRDFIAFAIRGQHGSKAARRRMIKLCEHTLLRAALLPLWCSCGRCAPCSNRDAEECFHTDEQPFRFRTQRCRDAWVRAGRPLLVQKP